MSEDLELTGGASGIDRRDFIRKSAIVGGMVWAAPMVSSIGSPAFAITEPGNGTGDPDCEDASYVAIVVTFGGTTYRLKWEFDEWAWETLPGPDGVEDDPDECYPDGWDSATKTNPTALRQIVRDATGDQSYDDLVSIEVTATQWIITVPEPLVCGTGSVKKGSPQGSGQVDICDTLVAEDDNGACVFIWDKVNCTPASS